MKNLLYFIICIISIKASAQPLSPVQQEPMVIMNATIHCGDGRVIENGIMAFDQGKITFIADARLVKFDPRGYKIIDASGKHVYPGLIAMNTQIGLQEIEAVRATNDAYEVTDIHPNVRSIIAYNTDSRVIPTLRSNGILLAQVVPGGGSIHGSSSVVMLDAWNWEDAVYSMDNGIHMTWPGYYSYSWNNGWTRKINPEYESSIAELHRFFSEAKAYRQRANDEPINLILSSMQGIFTGTQQLYIEANNVREISNAILFAEEFGIRPVIVGGEEAHLVAEELAAKEIPVVLTGVHRLPLRTEDLPDQAFKQPNLLVKAGVLCAISMESYWNIRNLPFSAGTASAYGLDKEAALQLITLNPAKILGIDSLCGSLDNMKDATFIVCEGDIMNMQESNVSRAFIQGREVDLFNWQNELDQKYRNKYGITE
jgi:imidazolonepropionase-like amidohydrolase